MFSKLSLSIILTASVACVGQVTTMGGGYATSAVSPGTAADAPLIATPDIALPGSGPAVGAPITSANDPRTATGPSIHNPNYLPTVSESAEGASFGANAPAGTSDERIELGIQHFISGAPAAASTPRESLAEIARAIRARTPKASRAFDNESIAKLNADGVRTGNLGPESSTTPASTELAKAPADNTLVAENQMPALPQSDQPATAPSRQNSSTAAQQRHRDETPAEPQAAPTPAPAQASAPKDHSENTAKLPQTSSYLPLILFLGAIGIAGGTIYFMRR